MWEIWKERMDPAKNGLGAAQPVAQAAALTLLPF